MSAALNHKHDRGMAAAAVSVGMTHGRGRGLFASVAMKDGATVLVERPLAAMQSLDNAQDVTVCRNCLGFAGDVISQLEVLSGLPRQECVERYSNRLEGSHSHYDDNGEKSASKNSPVHQLSGLCECLDGCGEVYCSPRCRSEHFERGHGLLCVGPVPEDEAQDHPLVSFRVHAMQTNEIFLLVGEVMAQIATAFFKNKTDGSNDDDSLAAARAPFADFVQEPWWDVAVSRDSQDEQASLSGTLRALCDESSALLRRAFACALGALPASLEEALSAERFGRVVGMFEQNNMGIRAPSPIPEMLRELLSEDNRPNNREFLAELAGLVGEVMDDAECDDSGDEAASSSSCEGSKAGDGGRGCCGGEVAGLVGEVTDDTECDDSSEEGVLLPSCGGDKAGHDGHECCGGDVAGEGGDLNGLGRADSETATGEGRMSIKEEEDERVAAVLRRAIDDDSPEESFVAPLDGTALYSLVCCMNHSCRPNCEVHYPGRRRRHRESTMIDPGTTGLGSADPLVAEVVLLEDVSAGDELTQSYVSRDMGVVERRQALLDYGFWCTCSRCSEEEVETWS